MTSEAESQTEEDQGNHGGTRMDTDAVGRVPRPGRADSSHRSQKP